MTEADSPFIDPNLGAASDNLGTFYSSLKRAAALKRAKRFEADKNRAHAIMTELTPAQRTQAEIDRQRGLTAVSVCTPTTTK